MHIRLATLKDERNITDLVIAFQNYLERKSPLDSEFSGSIRILLSSQDAEFFVASEGAEILGYVLQRYRHSMWANGIEATIEDLFVDPACRKHGAGKSLIEFAIARATHRSCASICLDTNEFNTASTKICTSLGFTSHSQRWGGRQVFFRKSITAA